jgi:predicted nucleotide-binding protein (sugar kinase/HSP70/actin superfamily)
MQRLVFRIARWYLETMQEHMIDILQQAGFESLPPFRTFKQQAEGYAPLRITLADGWLISAEAVGWVKLGYRKILCIQPFACLPGHIFGKGQYAQLQRKLPDARLVSVDYDASTGEGTVQSRIRMLLDEQL